MVHTSFVFSLDVSKYLYIFTWSLFVNWAAHLGYFPSGETCLPKVLDLHGLSHFPLFCTMIRKNDHYFFLFDDSYNIFFSNISTILWKYIAPWKQSTTTWRLAGTQDAFGWWLRNGVPGHKCAQTLGLPLTLCLNGGYRWGNLWDP